MAVWGWGGISHDFVMKDGGTAFREGGYIRAPLKSAILLDSNVIALPVIPHEVYYGEYPRWARSAIGNDYDPVKSRFYNGMLTILTPQGATDENLNLQSLNELNNTRRYDYEAAAEDAMSHAQTTVEVFRSMNADKPLTKLRKSLRRDREREVEQEDERR